MTMFVTHISSVVALGEGDKVAHCVRSGLSKEGYHHFGSLTEVDGDVKEHGLGHCPLVIFAEW